MFVLEYIFYLCFFVYKGYWYIDKLFVISPKLSRVDSYLNKDKKNSISFNYIFKSLIISFNFTLIRIIFSYKFFLSNFYTINIFSNVINISNILGSNYYLFKLLFFFLHLFFYLFLSYYVLKYYYKFKNKLKNSSKNYVFNKGILLGKYNDKDVYLNKFGMYQNVCITGSIGSGKTSSCISNFLNYFMKENINGLIIDIKGSYINDVRKISKLCGKNIVEISLYNNFKYNPLNIDISELEIANRVIKVLKLLSDNNKSDSYFLDKCEEYIKDFLILMKEYNKVNFKELHLLVLDKKYLKEKIRDIKESILNNKYNNEKLFKLNNAINNLSNEYLNLDDRNLNIIRSEITRVTNLFIFDYNVYKKFCYSSDKLDFRNNLYVLSLDDSKNSKLSKTIATYIKLEFQKQILQIKGKTTFFICDEYQEIVNKEDSKFYALSREFRCINVIAMQSYTSLLNSLNSKYNVDSLIQNFVNKVWFRNDDIYTIENIIKQLGKKEIERKSLNVNQNLNKFKYSLLKKDYISDKASLTKGYTVNKYKEDILDFNYFSNALKTFEAVISLSDGININTYKKVKLKRWNKNED